MLDAPVGYITKHRVLRFGQNDHSNTALWLLPVLRSRNHAHSQHTTQQKMIIILSDFVATMRSFA